MRMLAIIALAVSLLTVGCGGNGTSRAPESGGAGGATSSLKPGDIKPMESPTKVSWIALKQAAGRVGQGTGMTHMHLVNKAHPEAGKPIPLKANEKVLSNNQMGALLALLREKRFDEFATAGLTAPRVPSGTANGIIVVETAGRARGLVFLKNLPQGSPIALSYQECRNLILGIWNKADQYQAYTSEDERVLGIGRLPSGVGR